LNLVQLGVRTHNEKYVVDQINGYDDEAEQNTLHNFRCLEEAFLEIIVLTNNLSQFEPSVNAIFVCWTDVEIKLVNEHAFWCDKLLEK